MVGKVIVMIIIIIIIKVCTTDEVEECTVEPVESCKQEPMEKCNTVQTEVSFGENLLENNRWFAGLLPGGAGGVQRCDRREVQASLFIFLSILKISLAYHYLSFSVTLDI